MNWKLKDILMIAIVGVLFAFVFMGANYLGVALTAALTPVGLAPLGYQLIYGLWFMAASFGAYIIQKKGAATISEVLAASIEMMMGGMFGPMVLVNGFIQGFGFEIGLILTGYKKYNMASMCLGSVTCALISYVSEFFFYGYSAYSIGMNLMLIVVRVISSILFTGILSKVLADGLAKAGVLRGYALGMKSDNLEEM